MTEQMNHRAAIERAVRQVAYYAEHKGEYAAECDNPEYPLLAAHYLAAIKATWPGGRIPKHVKRGHGDEWTSDWAGWVNSANTLGDGDTLNSKAVAWCFRANKFERDYPGLKVDDPWLVKVMEGVK